MGSVHARVKVTHASYGINFIGKVGAARNQNYKGKEKQYPLDKLK
jgi:hypothetical protein